MPRAYAGLGLEERGLVGRGKFSRGASAFLNLNDSIKFGGKSAGLFGPITFCRIQKVLITLLGAENFVWRACLDAMASLYRISQRIFLTGTPHLPVLLKKRTHIT